MQSATLREERQTVRVREQWTPPAPKLPWVRQPRPERLNLLRGTFVATALSAALWAAIYKGVALLLSRLS